MLVPIGTKARPSGPTISVPDTLNSPSAVVGVGAVGPDGTVEDALEAPPVPSGADDVSAAVVVGPLLLSSLLHAAAASAHTPTRTAIAVRFARRMGFASFRFIERPERRHRDAPPRACRRSW